MYSLQIHTFGSYRVTIETHSMLICSINCLNCDKELSAEQDIIVFCDQQCLKEYMADQHNLESFLANNAMKEMDL